MLGCPAIHVTMNEFLCSVFINHSQTSGQPGVATRAVNIIYVYDPHLTDMPYGPYDMALGCELPPV